MNKHLEVLFSGISFHILFLYIYIYTGFTNYAIPQTVQRLACLAEGFSPTKSSMKVNPSSLPGKKMQQNPNQFLARNVPKNKKTYVTRGPNKQTTVVLVFLPTRFVFDTLQKSWKQ